MNKKQMLEMLKVKNDVRAKELQKRADDPNVNTEDLAAIEKEATDLATEAKKVADELANLGAEDDTKTDDTTDENTEEKSGEDESTDERDGVEESDEQVDPAVRSAITENIKGALTARGKRSKKTDTEVRSIFANFVVGKGNEAEARALGIVNGDGSVTVPDVVASEVITYAQEENLLRKYGTVVKTAGNVKYPILVKKADANVHKLERGTADGMSETEIAFDTIELSPVEFDALATVTRKLLLMTGVNVEDIVIQELTKAYVRKEANYMFNGDDTGNENPGALAKKAVTFTPSTTLVLTSNTAGQQLYDALVELKNTPVTEIMKKGRFILNRAALTLIEKMKTTDGFPLLRPFTQVEGGIGQSLIGYPVDWTDYADKKGATDTPIVYFGDFSAFHIQDVQGAMSTQRLVETYANTNRVGFQIYNLVDGQLVYSPFEPAVYRFEVVGAAETPKE